MKIHCVGIGGIGISALARYYMAEGNEITGSDLYDSEIIFALKKIGAEISIGKHQANSLPDNVDLVIFSAAVPENNPELEKAKAIRLKKPSLELLNYAEALGRLTRQYSTIAVSGTHGKSTTVAMLSLVLIEAGLDPTVIVGTKLKEFGDSNFRMGHGRYLVIEADEWQGSFLNYHPDIIVLTNIEEDHLDYYRDLNHIRETYQKYLERLSPVGSLVFNEDDSNIIHLLANQIIKKRVPFSMKQEEAEKLSKIIKIPGKHNTSNALAAMDVSRLLGIPDDVFYRAIGQYRSCWRRFDERKGKIGKDSFMLIHDYAHHPTELKSLFQAIDESLQNKKIWFIFQPHQYQRTFYFFDRFVDVLREQGEAKNDYQIIITDIYGVPGREEQLLSKKVSARKMVSTIDQPNVHYWPFKELTKRLAENIKRGDVVVAVGAGDIYQWAHKFEE